MNTEQKLQVKVTAVTIMYGDRWRFLSQVLEAVMRDPYITTFVIVDNGSKNELEIKEGVKQYGDRVVVLRQEKNLGSAGGFAKGLEYARTTDSDFVFILDDDSVPEDGTVEKFMEMRKLFPTPNVVLCSNRVTVPGNKEKFYQLSLKKPSATGTFFEVFSVAKIANFVHILSNKKASDNMPSPFIPIIPVTAFVYGGSFIPMQAVKETPLPDASLFLYGDDIEYAWAVKKAGYDAYLCASPLMYDVDLTFGEGSHIFGLFEAKTLPFKVFYRVRNMVRISRKHSSQSAPVLFINMFVWILGLYVLGFLRFGPTTTYFSRAKLIMQAVIAGFSHSSTIPKEAQIA
jgi:GT2 family glycosyltransferase